MAKRPGHSYKLTMWIGRTLHDMREGLSWPQVMSILGNAAEGDITEAVVHRMTKIDVEGKYHLIERSSLMPKVARYSEDGIL